MLPKNMRLTSREVEEVLSKGHKFSERGFYYKKIPYKGQKYGIVLTGKAKIGSVKRNFLRRTIYLLLSKKTKSEGKVVFFIPKEWSMETKKNIEERLSPVLF